MCMFVCSQSCIHAKVSWVARDVYVLQVSLPPSDGIEVLEEDYEFPEKDPDASEGWIDVRGEFQSY